MSLWLNLGIGGEVMRTLNEFFKPEDFETAPTVFQDRHIAANIANRILQSEVEKWPKVNSTSINGDTRTSRLAFLEEIKKEPCKHEPSKTVFIYREYPQRIFKTNCEKCGVELYPEWKEVK